MISTAIFTTTMSDEKAKLNQQKNLYDNVCMDRPGAQVSGGCEVRGDFGGMRELQSPLSR